MIKPRAKGTTSTEIVVLKYRKEPALLGEIADSKSGMGDG